jgi:hypothetical protein
VYFVKRWPGIQGDPFSLVSQAIEKKRKISITRISNLAIITVNPSQTRPHCSPTRTPFSPNSQQYILLNLALKHLLKNQCTPVLNIMAPHNAQGMRASIIMFVLTSSASPEIVAAVMANTKMGAWYLSSSCRRYAKEEIAQPRARHAPSITVGDGSKMKVMWPGSKARICSLESGVRLRRCSVCQ